MFKLRTFVVVAAALLGCVCGLQTPAHTHRGSATANPSGQITLQIPNGTILPVRLNHGFSSKNARKGTTVNGRVMQDVPLPSAQKIPQGAKITGSILSVSADPNGVRRISFRFDHLIVHRQSIPIVTNLRAMASFVEVGFAYTPEMTPGFGDPYVWSTTHQIGGDVKYGVGGPVTDQWSQNVGQGTFDGVLVHVRARPGTNCRGAVDNEDRLQALWVFSSDACGVYGMTGVKILHAGRTDPVGEIILVAERGQLKVPGGTGMLLRVIQE